MRHWRDEFDWRGVEARLSAHDQYLTEIDGATVHVLHARSPEPGAVPLVLTHGWPGTALEWLDVLGPLSDPRAHGLDPALAFDVVVPSIPGFGFSGPAPDVGWGPRRIAAAWLELMSRLGYERFVAAGNDWGSFVSPAIAVAHPSRVLGVHVTQAWAPPPADDPGAVERLDATDRATLEAFARYDAEQSAYGTVAAQAPQTLAHALDDSPVGLLGWIVQAMPDLDADARVAAAALLWLTVTAGSALRIYQAAAAEPAAAPTPVPVAVAQFPGDLPSIRAFAEHVHPDLRSWTVFDRGGHYAARQAPDLLVGDLRRFVGELVAQPVLPAGRRRPES